MNNGITGFNLILWLCILLMIIYFGYELYMWLLRRQSAKLISQEEFQSTMKQAQIIDVREPQEFKSKHILGARNVPYSQAKMGIPGFNKSQPLYLYDDGMNLSVRMAKILKKAGYTEIYILKNGMSGWTGKVKRSED